VSFVIVDGDVVISGQDLGGTDQIPTVSTDDLDGKNRVAVDGKVSIAPPAPPATGTRVIIYADSPETVPGNQERDNDHVITDSKRFFIQQVIVGAEGDPNAAGSVVRLIYSPDGGTTEKLIQKFYVRGHSYPISFPNISTTRDGTQLDGVAVSQGIIRIRRERLGGGGQEIDATIIGYEDTP
jgi:hypothetical protein